MAEFKITDRYQGDIVSTIEGVDINQFPLLSRVLVVDGSVLQTFEVEDAKAKNFITQGLNENYQSEISFDDAGNLTPQALMLGVDLVTRDLYSQIEAKLFEGAKAKAGAYTQGLNDILIVQDNDFTPLSIPSFETGLIAKGDTLESIAINPNTALIVGDITPEIVITKDVRKNVIKVFGTITAIVGWYGDKVAKVVKGEITIPVTSITLSQTNLSGKPTDNWTLQAIVKPDNATDKTVTWSTTNKNVATVENGVVTAVGDGTATIKGKTKNGLEASCKVTVATPPVP